MGGLYQPAPQQGNRTWVPLAVGFALVVLAIAAIYSCTRSSRTAGRQSATDIYAGNVLFTDLKLSRAENFVGAAVTYIEGKVSNTGTQTVIGAQVEIIFRNSLGEVVQKETHPLRVATSQMGQTEYVALSPQLTLVPNQTREFRFTFEHISADWNQGYPELRVVQTRLQ